MAYLAVRMTIQWQVAAGEARSIIQALHTLMDSARTEHGYVNCSVSTELGEVATLRYREEWQTEEDLEREVRSSRFAKVAQLIELASRPPQVQFHLPGGVRGLDYAEELIGREHHERR